MFNFENLDENVRTNMLEAIEEAEQSGNIYFSKEFNKAGMEQWVPLLRQAATEFNEHWLAFQLEVNQLMNLFEIASKPSGGYTRKHVPHNAAERIAEGQFNRFYILGLCKYAKAEGISHLEIYRAKERSVPRPKSQALIGTKISVEEIEDQLKETSASFKSQLVKPNSGISAKLP